MTVIYYKEFGLMRSDNGSVSWRRLFFSSLLAGCLAGCGNLSKVSPSGTTDSPIFPDMARASFSEGSWPNLDNLRKVQAGVNKNQLYLLIGHPHFSEGILGVREWDYIFHLPGDDGPQTCQYKILFDNEKHARSFFWKPETCAEIVEQKTGAASRALSLNSDIFFKYNSAQLTLQGVRELQQLAASLNGSVITEVRIVGHTDRLGSKNFNLDLSQRRADAVRAELAKAGIAPTRLKAMGAGATKPLQHCGAMEREALLQCLAPNRRVELLIEES
ncbi:OmpA family protein [Serratia ficaria]|uniref:OmpA family protein n=1 Tax=Serratia ficaria TaxID=61651 RepID=UPI00077C4914|nr:OmpA family protein [Serratia ficaria]